MSVQNKLDFEEWFMYLSFFLKESSVVLERWPMSPQRGRIRSLISCSWESVIVFIYDPFLFSCLESELGCWIDWLDDRELMLLDAALDQTYIYTQEQGREEIHDSRWPNWTSDVKAHPKYTMPCRHGNKVCINNTGDSLSPLETSGRIDNVDLASKLTIRLARKLYRGVLANFYELKLGMQFDIIREIELRRTRSIWAEGKPIRELQSWASVNRVNNWAGC